MFNPLRFGMKLENVTKVAIISAIREASGLGEAASCGVGQSGVVLGIYEPEDESSNTPIFTETLQRYNEKTCGRIGELLKLVPYPKLGEVRLFYGVDPYFSAVALTGMGKPCAGYNSFEDLDERKECIRIAAAVGAQALQEINVSKIHIESFGHAESSAEGANLGVWIYQELKDRDKQKIIPNLELFDDCDFLGWQIGMHKAEAQNLCRQLMDTPPNIMTPSTFAQNSVEILCGSGVNIEVKVRSWAEVVKMGAFLSVSKGSCEPPVFLELSYYGTDFDERPIVLIGKGVTFDSGGLCFKKPEDMLLMKGDMGGAATVVATARAIALLRLPINIRGLIPLCENMPGCLASKPGDIISSMSGKSILIQNTDCEGRLLLADALWYSQNFWPKFIIDIGSLTNDVRNALGSAAAGVWTNADHLWERVRLAGIHTGDRLWRFPLWRYYTRQVTKSKSVDIKNVGHGPGGGANKAAAFLREFVPCGEWMHIDSFGTMFTDGNEVQYLRKGMSGRPTRTLIEFLSALACKN